MDLVEKAAQRLAQLQKAGVEVPVPETPAAPTSQGPGAERIPTPERLADALQRAQVPEVRAVDPAPSKAEGSATPGRSPRVAAAAGSRSKVVHIDLEALAAGGFVAPGPPVSALRGVFRVIKRAI